MPVTLPDINDLIGPTVTEGQYKTKLSELFSAIGAAALTTDIYGMKNRLINGAFNVNQAGLTTAADAVYHLDQWYALTESGNVTIAQQTNQENGQPFNLRMTQPDVTAKRMGSAQPIESINCRDLRGQTVALRARIRCSSPQAIRWAVVEWTGTADAITKDIVNTWSSGTFTTGNFFISTTTTIAATGSVTPAANTWTDLLASATISSSANNLIVFIWSEGTLAQNATLDLGAVQLAQGAQTPFEARPVGLELALAQRYYETIDIPASQSLVAVVWTASSNPVALWIFKSVKMVTPTFSGSAASRMVFPSGAVAGGAITGTAASVIGVTIGTTNTIAAASAGWIDTFTATAIARL